MTRAVLDATTGGKHIWHGEMEDADRVVFADRRAVPAGEIDQQPGWDCTPDILTDYRRLPFDGGTFDLVCFDPPHRVTDGGMEQVSGIIEMKYGAIHAETWQVDIRAAFDELWRVLRPGGVLTLKWADIHKPSDRVLELLPETPLYGAKGGKEKTDVKWWVFHKPREA